MWMYSFNPCNLSHIYKSTLDILLNLMEEKDKNHSSEPHYIIELCLEITALVILNILPPCTEQHSERYQSNM